MLCRREEWSSVFVIMYINIIILTSSLAAAAAADCRIPDVLLLSVHLHLC